MKHKFELQNGRTLETKKSALGECVIYASDLGAITSDEYNEFALLIKKYEERQMSPDKMIQILAEKLTDEEFFQLFLLLDGDGPAGPFWQGVAQKSEELFPEEFNKNVIDQAAKEELTD